MPKKNSFRIFANRSGIYMGNRICKALAKRREKTILELPQVQDFAVGESKVVLKNSVRASNIFLIQSPINKFTTRSIHDELFETLMTIDTMKGCGASKIVLIMPCLPYTRQDKRFGREPCTASIIAQLLSNAGIDHIITVDIHADQILEYFKILGVQADGLYASPILISYIKRNFKKENLWILSPDAGGLKRAMFYANKLGAKVAVAAKSRSYEKSNFIDEVHILGDLHGGDVIIVDDMVDTGGTVCKVIEKLHKQGVNSVSICTAHPLLSPPAVPRLDKLHSEGKLDKLIATDSIFYPIAFHNLHPWFVQLPLAPLLADVILAIHKGESISKFYL